MTDSDLDTAMAALLRAVGIAGGQAPFERKTGLRQQTISYRLANRIPLRSGDEVLKVENATGVSRHDLRPDLYPREESPAHPPAPQPLPAGGSSSSLESAQA